MGLIQLTNKLWCWLKLFVSTWLYTLPGTNASYGSIIILIINKCKITCYSLLYVTFGSYNKMIFRHDKTRIKSNNNSKALVNDSDSTLQTAYLKQIDCLYIDIYSVFTAIQTLFTLFRIEERKMERKQERLWYRTFVLLYIWKVYLNV